MKQEFSLDEDLAPAALLIVAIRRMKHIPKRGIRPPKALMKS